MTDLEEAEVQHSRALSGHLQNVDRLLQLQRCRLRCMEEGYRAQLEELQEEFETERYRGGDGGGTRCASWALSTSQLVEV